MVRPQPTADAALARRGNSSKLWRQAASSPRQLTGRPQPPGTNSGFVKNGFSRVNSLRLDDGRYFTWTELNAFKATDLSRLHRIL
jgi:hypothetical protein